MGEFITLKEVLAFMDTGRKFSISFITYDKKNQEGGELVELKTAHKHNWASPAEFRKIKRLHPEAVPKKLVKDPRHYENSTRNIVKGNSDLCKVHIRLIRKFNGKTVL
jgi:hypothetical protein